MQLSIVIPACNEEQRIGPMLDAYLRYFSARYGSDAEFIVVVNGSTDGTEGVVRDYMTRNPALSCIVESRRVGKGGALMLGFGKARGEKVGFADADGSTPPEAFQELVDNIGDAGAIIASRWRRGSKVSPRQPFARRVASRVLNLLTRVVFGLPLTDTQCGAKLVRREPLIRVLPDLGITRWAFDIDLLFQLKRNGYKVREIPTVWHDIRGSKVDIAVVSVEMFAAVVRLRLLYSPFRWVVGLYDRYLGPFIHPPGLEHDHLFRHSLLFMTGIQMANVVNLLFHVVMMRLLTQAEYGVVAAMLGVFLIVCMPMGALLTTVAHFSARFVQEGEIAGVRWLVMRISRDMLIVALILVTTAIVWQHQLAGFFRLDTPAPILITSIALAAMLFVPIFNGALIGCQSFVWVSSIQIAWSLMRIVVAVICVAVGLAASGALCGLASAAALSLVLAVVALRRVLGPSVGTMSRPIRGIYPYFLRYMIALAAYSVLINANMVLVKHYFGAEEAGLFAQGARVALIMIFLPQPIAVAMFPKVVSSGKTSYESWRTLLKALALVTFITGSAAIVFTVFARPVSWVITHSAEPALAPLVRGMVWALTPLSIVFVIMNFELAQRRFVVMIPLVLCAAGYVVGVSIWHQTLWQIVLLLAVAAVAALAASAACLLVSKYTGGAQGENG